MNFHAPACEKEIDVELLAAKGPDCGRVNLGSNAT